MDITESQTAWDPSDRVELSGEEYEAFLARLDAASATVNTLKGMFESIRAQIQKEKLGIIIPNLTMN
jgi:hypothetical protein